MPQLLDWQSLETRLREWYDIETLCLIARNILQNMPKKGFSLEEYKEQLRKEFQETYDFCLEQANLPYDTDNLWYCIDKKAGIGGLVWYDHVQEKHVMHICEAGDTHYST